MVILKAILAIISFLTIAFLLSNNKRHINKQLIVIGLFWQIVFTIVMLKSSAVAHGFEYLSMGVQALSTASNKGASFVFGSLAIPPAGSNLGFILAFQGFPVLITLSAFSSLLIYLKILPFIIRVFSLFFRKTLKIGGTLGIAVSANVFTGMSETPLVIRTYLKHLTHSELFSLMAVGTAGIASSVLVLLTVIITPMIPNAINHIVASILICIPGALTISRIMVPETTKDLTEGCDGDFSQSKSALDAIYIGIVDGAKVTVMIIAMLIGFIALVDLANQIMSLLPHINNAPISIQRILGVVASPITWLVGIPSHETQIAGSILGSKLIFNEVLAFQELATQAHLLSGHTKILMIYLLCNFANIGSIGVMLGVYSTLIPERKSEVMDLGPRAILAGVITNCITTTMVMAIY